MDLLQSAWHDWLPDIMLVTGIAVAWAVRACYRVIRRRRNPQTAA